MKLLINSCGFSQLYYECHHKTRQQIAGNRESGQELQKKKNLSLCCHLCSSLSPLGDLAPPIFSAASELIQSRATLSNIHTHIRAFEQA